MTIAEFITRRLLAVWGYFATVFLVFALAAVVMGRQVSPVLFGVLFVLFAGGALYIQFAIRCPRCKGNLGFTIGQAMLPIARRRKPRFCPFCGVSLDEEL